MEQLGADGFVRAKNVVIRGVSIPSAKVENVEGGELDLDFEVELPRMKIKTFPDMPEIIERIVTRFWLEITPKLVVHIGNLRLEGLVISVEADAVKLDGLTLPFALRTIAAQDVELAEVAIEGVELASSSDRKE